MHADLSVKMEKNFYSTLRVVVTGASGFIGKHTIQRLKLLDVEVFEIDKSKGFDICNLKSLNFIPSFDVMIHLAAENFVPESYHQLQSFYKTNIYGTLNCLELCSKYKARMIFASSYVYGKPIYLPIDEKHPTSHWNPYASSKLVGEILCKDYEEYNDVNCTILRIFNVFGEGQSEKFLIPKILRGLNENNINLISSIPRRDFIYVEDLVNAFILALLPCNDKFRVYNLGSGISLSVAEIVNIILEASGKNIIPTFQDILRPNEIMDVIANSSKIKNELGWNLSYSFKTGLIELLTHVTQNS